MSKFITFRVPNELYEVFERTAVRTGRSIETVAIGFMAKHAPKPRPKLSEEELREAREEFRLRIGAVSLGYPTGTDNESIDADLAREYGNTYEEE